MKGGRAFFLGSTFFALGAAILFFSSWYRISFKPVYGFTFSSMYAESLGIDAQETLHASLAAFQPQFVRLPLYWDVVEPVQGQYDWNASDAYVSQIHAAGAEIHMTIGAKVPRWPECFVPIWVDFHQRELFERALLSYEESVITRYKDDVDIWQIENEPFFAFGDCPETRLSFLLEEIALVRRLDADAQVQITVSGEQQLWGSVVPFADRVGVSVYRQVRNAFVGSFSFPLSPMWYMFMRLPVEPFRHVVISELQMEPWFTSHPRYLDLDVAASYFTAQDAQNNVAYARATGFSEVSFWGVEWWYYLREHGYPELWDTMQNLLNGE
jgi:hypothetical protein